VVEIGKVPSPTTPVTSAIAKASVPVTTPGAGKTPATTAQVQTAVANPGQSFLNRGMFWAIAGILGIVSLAIVFLAKGRGKAVHSASLITRSYERK